MSKQLSNSSIKPSIKNVSASAVAPAPATQAQVAPDVAGDEPVKKARQAYEPKTALEFEESITQAAEALRSFKTRLYPTSAPKACLDRAPTRREIDDQISAINSLKRDYKAQVRRAEQKPRRKTAAPGTKARTGGFKNPCVVDQKLAEFIAEHFNTEALPVIDESRICTRALLTSMMTQYAHDHGRRDPTAATKVIPDGPMKELFSEDFGPAGVDATGFPHTHMQKLLTRHVMPSVEFKAYVLSEKLDLETYKPHLESVQNHFKEQKLVREANKPKPVKRTAAAKKAAAEASALAQAE